MGIFNRILGSNVIGDGVTDAYATLACDLAEAQRKNRELDGVANAFRIQRDAARIECAGLRDQLRRFLDRQEKAKLNLKQFRKPKPDGAGEVRA